MNPHLETGHYSISSNVFTEKTSFKKEAVLCYHCGLQVEEKSLLRAPLAGKERIFCCAGCQAVSTLIHEGGLDQYYQRRDQLPEQEMAISSEDQATWALYDDPAMQQRFVKTIHAQEKEASLAIEGLRCAACVWLNEQHLLRQSGIISVSINHTTQRARIHWNPQVISLSRIFEAIAEIGYRAWPFDGEISEMLRVKEQRSTLFRMAVAVMGMMQVMMYAWPVYFSKEGIDPQHHSLLNWVSLLLTLPVVIYSAAPLYRSAWRGVMNQHIGMDIPVVIGVSAAFITSCIATVKGHGEVYFDSVSMFIGLLLSARYLEVRLRQKARASIEKSVYTVPAVCERWAQYPEGKPEVLAVMYLKINDMVYVKAGEIFPGDGVVISGKSEAEEALLTGESHPVPKQEGDQVFAGSYNYSSPLVVRITQLGEDTQIAEITRLLDKALAEKPRMAEVADRVASWFVVALLVIAGAVGVFWWKYDPARALMVTVSVLVVSCPCALSLATPAALAAATGTLARHSLLILGKQTLENLSQITDVVLDKTGTLTTGYFKLQEIRITGSQSADYYHYVAAALAQGSPHPLAKQLVSTYQEKSESLSYTNGTTAALKLSFPKELKQVAGMGMEGVIGGELWRIGRYEFVKSLGTMKHPILQEELPSHFSTVWCANQEGIQAVFLFSDDARDGAEHFIKTMQLQGKRVHLLSGDREEAVNFWARKWGVEYVQAQSTPLEKKNYVHCLQERGAIVAMMGDGINDAPVLGLAQVSMTLADGTPLAKAGADIVLLGQSLHPLSLAFTMAARTRKILLQNLTWAFLYNLIAIPLAATGSLTPLAAGAGMSLSSLLVVLNALRLVRIQEK